jgi:hypothetical protein
MGRVLLSTRSFNPVDIVLTYTPLVTFTDFFDLAKKYARMNKEERALIMDLKHLCKPDDAENFDFDYTDFECRNYMLGCQLKL